MTPLRRYIHVRPRRITRANSLAALALAAALTLLATAGFRHDATPPEFPFP